MPKSPNCNLPCEQYFLLSSFDRCHLLIEPQKVLFVSRIQTLHRLNWVNPVALGLTRFNRRFYSVIDVHHLLHGKSLGTKGFFVFLLGSHNALFLPHLASVERQDLTVSAFPQTHPLPFCVPAFVYKEQVAGVLDCNLLNNGMVL